MFVTEEKQLFPRKDKWETGLKLDSTEVSRCVFLRRGLTTACLKAAGTDPELRQVFIKTSKRDPTELKTSFRNLAGIMSKGQLVGFRPLTTLVRDDREIVSNCSKTADCAGGTHTSSGDISILLIFCLTDAMLSIRKETNSSQVVVEASDRTAEHGLITESIVLNR